MFASLLILLVLPITNRSRIRGSNFAPFSKLIFWVLVVVFFALFWLGGNHAEAPYILLGQIFTALYFSYFVLLVPVVSLLENTLSDINNY